jgi:AraC-like DNA-binding protein
LGFHRILIIIDDSQLGALAVRALEFACDVVSVRNPSRALDFLSSARTGFDAVVVAGMPLPPRLPLMGLTVVRTMFQRWPWIPVVVVVRSHEMARVRAATLVSGAQAFIEWPFTASELTQLVERVVRRRHNRPRAAPGVVARVKGLLALLDQNPAEVPTLEEMAARAGMSRSYFSRAFHATAGVSLRHYVRDLRLKAAYELLNATKLSLTAIAVEAGFYDLPHLDKAFRERLGMSPHQFRRRYRASPAYGAMPSRRPANDR